ncbi:MAG: UDP-N-acetylmuramoyl-tripeptide--D-alanyl-D-alanine ligase [Lachnospiraceae bacterium]|nr:UDP-N-acetylmuramoyl-tripeptide--D-alanyl-D-alanine ligase [Lachnospiraceae bacterium]
MRNLTLSSVAKAIKGELFCEASVMNNEINGAVIDSREIEKDYLFFAVKGQRVDGHDFIEQVYEKGALAVISEKILDTDKPYILVKSSLEALKLLAKYYRSTLDIPVVGITGSVGKTSTKEFIASVLSEKYNVLKTEGNFNNEIGLPLTILKIREEHEAAVLEMGISDFGEMTRLSDIAKPDICVITNIGVCHLENLGNRDGVLKAKTEMFANAKENCEIVLNGDDDKLITIQHYKDKSVHYFGTTPQNEVYAADVINYGIDGTNCNIHLNSTSFNVDIHIPGIHMVNNALAATLVGNILGVSTESIRNGIEKLVDAAGRVNIIRRNYTIIDDCYNANPVSMKASIDLLNTSVNRKIAVLGDMFELGENESRLHYEIGEYIANTDIDFLFLSGELSKNILEGYINKKQKSDSANWFENVNDLIYNLKQFVVDQDTILVKASHSMHYEEIVKALS